MNLGRFGGETKNRNTFELGRSIEKGITEIEIQSDQPAALATTHFEQGCVCDRMQALIVDRSNIVPVPTQDLSASLA